jgi:hypothetical protein
MPNWTTSKIEVSVFAIFKIAATIPHKFNIVRLQRPELIPDIEKFLPVSIFKMAASYSDVSLTTTCQIELQVR